MIKKFIATILIIILGGNMAFCQNIDDFVIGNNKIKKEELQNLIDTCQDDINRIIKKEKNGIGDTGVNGIIVTMAPLVLFEFVTMFVTTIST